MKSQSTRNGSSFLSTYLNSTWRLAVIAPLVFGVAVLFGYTATAKAPVLIKKIIGPRTVQAPLTDPVPEHPLGHLLHVANVDESSVYTDKPNYQPGETALIFGFGFAPNELVTLQVVHLNGTAEGGEGHEPWDVLADEFGNFTSMWFVNLDDSAGSQFLLTARGNSSGLEADFVFSDGSANLDTCANGPTSAPVQCTGANWENGNLNATKSHYFEGDSVPYRTVFEDLVVGHAYTITIEYDTTQGGTHAFDYLTSFDRTEPTPGNNPCTQKQGGSIVDICDPTSFVTTPIPVDPNATAGQDGIPGNGDDFTQVPGVFTLFNGNALSIVNPGSPYTLSGSYAANSSTAITVQFNATDTTAVLAWSGHISTRVNWGTANSAIAINGSPYHMRLTNLTCSGAGEVCNVGNQDHQLSADAVFFPIQLTIIKETNPDDAPSKTFNYTTTGSNLGPFSLTPPNGTTPVQQVFSLTDLTARTVTESDPHATAPEFNLSNLSCTQTDGGLGIGSLSTDLGTRTVSFTPKEGQTVSCTFINTEDFTATRGKIIVDKVTNPTGDPTSFDFTTTYGSPFSLTDAAPPNDSGQTLQPGTYQVSETANPNYVTTATCTSSKGDPADDPSSINLSAGEVVTCTFTNTKRGKIIVEKQTNPNGAAGSFTFTGDAVGSISDGGQIVVNNVAPGTYTSTESDPTPAFDLTSISCDDGASATPSTTSLGTRTATFKVDPGETVKCTFTNSKRGHIIIDKVTNPSGDPTNFNFDASGGSYADFSLTDAAAPNDQTLVPGNYSVSETVPSGWNQTNSQCVSSIGDTETAAALELDAGETITCTFTNTKRGHIIVDKITTPSGDTTSFNFDANGGSYADFSLTDAAPPNDQTLVPGNYSVSETVPSGWDLTSSPCVSSLGHSETTASITLNAGETVTCKFYNRKRATLVVEKQTNPDGASGTFTFTGTAAGSIGDGGTITVPNLVPGTYTSAENNPTPNFDLTSISCNDGNSTGDVPSRTATFRLEAGETVKCTFTNTQRGMAQVVKTVSGVAPAAGQSFTFELRQGASPASEGTILESKNTDAGGTINFTTKLVAGQTYQICEWVFPGWNTNLTGDGPLFVPNSIIPPALPNPNVNNLTVCANFNVQPGQTRTFTVDNTPPPGGRALTIGFWKNWASCSNSNGKGQKPLLDLALGFASATTTNPPGGLVLSAQNPGSLWPNYASLWYLVMKGNPASTPNNIRPAPDCTSAVNLLDKTTIDGKKKSSSDPLFNLTAQLIAAQLNRFMGAGINGTTIMNIDRAVLLNGKYKFNGLTYTPKLTTADTNTANCLATQLDNYNNGRLVGLCP
jgi:hypothetical protein